MNNGNLKPNEIRKIIWNLSVKRAIIQKKLSYPKQMVDGCIHTVYKKCGNPNCQCSFCYKWFKSFDADKIKDNPDFFQC